jgi:glutamate-ammonia-ligase adenylyltransferase
VERPGVPDPAVRYTNPLTLFVQRLERVALSQRAHQRLDRFMPELLDRLDRLALDHDSLNRVFDLLLAICRRSAYLVLLVQHPKALDRLLELFDRSEWVANKVTRFPALLDELIDPALGRHIPGPEDLARGVGRILAAAQGAEAMLDSLNYLKLATSLRIAVGQLQGGVEGDGARASLSDLAGAVLAGVLEIAGREIRARHGGFRRATMAAVHHRRYGSLGAASSATTRTWTSCSCSTPTRGRQATARTTCWAACRTASGRCPGSATTRAWPSGFSVF